MQKYAIGCVCILLLSFASFPARAQLYPGFPFPICYEPEMPYVCAAPSILDTSGFGVLLREDYLQIVLENLDDQELNDFVNTPVNQIVPNLPNGFPTAMRGIVVAQFRARQQMAEELLHARATLTNLREYVQTDSPSCDALSAWAEEHEVIVLVGSSIPGPFSFSGAVAVFLLNSGNTVTERVRC